MFNRPPRKPDLALYIIILIVVAIVVVVIVTLLVPAVGTINSDHGNWNNL